jgi:predicted Zn-dependent protease
MIFRFSRLPFWGIFFLVAIGLSTTAALASPPGDSALWLTAARAQAELEQRRSLLDNSDVERYIDGIVSLLWTQAQSDLPPMQVRVLQDSQEDAFTYPNGICYLTSGILVKTRSRDQLAMIIAHEMIHYIRQHAQSAYQRVEPAAFDDGHRKPLSLSSLVDGAERQADREGFGLITQAGFCPDEALEIMPGDRRAIIIRELQTTGGSDGACRVEASVKQRHLDQIAPALKANARQALQKGRWIEADDSISRYLSVRPDDPQAYFIRGEILRLGPPDETGDTAEAAYQTAIDIDEAFFPALQALGMVFLKNGQTNKARQYFERCLSLSPQADASAYIRRYLQLCSE